MERLHKIGITTASIYPGYGAAAKATLEELAHGFRS